MKIAQVVCSFPPYKGGIGKVAYDYSQIISKKGFESYVFTPDYGKRGKIKCGRGEVRHLLPVLKFGNGAFLPQLLKELKNMNIVHLHYPFFGGAEVVWLAKKMGYKFKLIVHYHMDILNLSKMARFISYPLLLFRSSIINIADLVTCASADYIKTSQVKDLYMRDKFIEIPFGVDTEKFFPEKNKKTKKQKNILFVGGLDTAHGFKGVDVLIDAVSLLKYSDFVLRIVGNGNLKNRLRKQAQELGISGRIIFLENIPDEELAVLYRRSDLFILPSVSRHEAFGIVLLEAMASGVAVIASDLPGVNKVFNDGEQGAYTLAGDANCLAMAIDSYLNNDEKMQGAGKKGRELCLEKYDNIIMRDKLISVYENLYNQ